MTSQQIRVDAILPAGGRLPEPFAAAAGNPIKAMIEFGGQSILANTIQSLRQLDFIGNIVVVGPAETHEIARAAGASMAITEADTGPANIMLGLEWLRSQDQAGSRTLIATTDMPFLTSAGILNFITSCPADADICVPVVERTAFESVYPGLIRTDTRLSDGWFRVGGLYLLDPETLYRSRDYLEQQFAARKSNLKMAKLVGFGFILKYIFRRLSSQQIVNRASEILKCNGAIVRDAPPG